MKIHSFSVSLPLFLLELTALSCKLRSISLNNDDTEFKLYSKIQETLLISSLFKKRSCFMSFESCLQASLGIFPSPKGYIEGQILYRRKGRNFSKYHSLYLGTFWSPRIYGREFLHTFHSFFFIFFLIFHIFRSYFLHYSFIFPTTCGEYEGIHPTI